MLKSLSALVLGAAIILPQAAAATGLKSPSSMPPDNYKGQWWVSASGCSYSRAGRPGEVVWFLNRKPPKGTSCLEFIHQKKIDAGYGRAPFVVKG